MLMRRPERKRWMVVVNRKNGETDECAGKRNNGGGLYNKKHSSRS